MAWQRLPYTGRTGGWCGGRRMCRYRRWCGCGREWCGTSGTCWMSIFATSPKAVQLTPERIAFLREALADLPTMSPANADTRRRPSVAAVPARRERAVPDEASRRHAPRRSMTYCDRTRSNADRAPCPGRRAARTRTTRRCDCARLASWSPSETADRHRTAGWNTPSIRSSSLASRRTVTRGTSPSSTWPPGKSHRPLSHGPPAGPCVAPHRTGQSRHTGAYPALPAGRCETTAHPNEPTATCWPVIHATRRRAIVSRLAWRR
jgi:hypothetical protein